MNRMFSTPFRLARRSSTSSAFEEIATSTNRIVAEAAWASACAVFPADEIVLHQGVGRLRHRPASTLMAPPPALAETTLP